MKRAVLEERKKMSSKLMRIFPAALAHSRTNLHTPYLHARPYGLVQDTLNFFNWYISLCKGVFSSCL